MAVFRKYINMTKVIYFTSYTMLKEVIGKINSLLPIIFSLSSV